ncbi:hypothetical protein [Nocardiopsis nanhaiensis]
MGQAPIGSRGKLGQAPLSDPLRLGLDTLLRSGAEPPDTWKVTPGDSCTTWVYVTALYDSVSEVLRAEWDCSESAEALQSAAVYWQRLTSTLQEGAPLPEPWQQ